MRRRDRWLVSMLWAVSAAWCAVVWIYSLGERRERLRLRSRVETLESAAAAFSNSLRTVVADVSRPPSALSVSSASVVDDGDSVSFFAPRVLGFGQTRSTRRRAIYADVETSPGRVERRYSWLPPD